MGTDEWTVDSRSRYNKWDAISRSTTQVRFSCNTRESWS